MKHPQEKNLQGAAVKGSFWQGTSSLIQKAGGLIFTIIVARVLLPEGFGLYNLILAIVLIFATIASGGTNNALARYISYAIKKNSKKEEIRVFQFILRIRLIILIIVFTLLIIFSYPLSFYVFKMPKIFPLLILASLYGFIFSLDSFFTAFFFATKKVQHIASKETIFQVVRSVLVVLIFYLFMIRPTVSSVFVVMVLAILSSLSFLSHKLEKENSYLFSETEKVRKEEKTKLIKFIIFVTFTSVTYAFLGHIDTIMLGILLDETAFIGFYNAAFALMSGIGGFFSFNKVLLPLFVQVNDNNLESAFNKVLRFYFFITLPAAAGLVALGNFFLPLLYGPEYIAASPVLYILSVLIVCGIYAELLVSLFVAKERPRDYLSLIAFVVVLNIILNYIFIKSLLLYTHISPILGAAAATSLSSIFYAVGLTILAKRKLNVRANFGTITKPLVAALLMTILLLFVKDLMGELEFLDGVFLVILGVVSYLFFMFLFREIKKEDIILIKNLFMKS